MGSIRRQNAVAAGLGTLGGALFGDVPLGVQWADQALIAQQNNAAAQHQLIAAYLSQFPVSDALATRPAPRFSQHWLDVMLEIEMGVWER
jgi:hypothetical protein